MILRLMPRNFSMPILEAYGGARVNRQNRLQFAANAHCG